MRVRRRLLPALGLGLVGLLLAVVGGLAGHAIATSNGGGLRDDLELALDAREDLGEKDALIVELRGRIDGLEAEIAGLREGLDAEGRNVASREAEIARLTQLLASSGALDGEYERLQQQYATLGEQFASLQVQYDELARSWAQLTPVESPGLSGVALYLDQSGGKVAVTRPLCTGSMEPTITCDDLLVLYEPASLTDLDEGDVIYFRKPTADCSGYLEGRYTLHRIHNVISRSDGIWFETKGDAFANPDHCLVPADSVQFKLLTTIRDGRVAGG